MPSSAINNTGRSVYSGTAVAVNGDTIQMASSSVLATALVHLGAGQNGIVSLVGTGEVLDLQDWTLATGSKLLTPNAQYFTTENQGKLAVGSGSQSVGTATSPTTLAVNISPIFSVTQNITNILNQNITTIAQQVAKLLQTSGAQLIPGIGPPFSGVGNLGDYYTDTSTGLIYGPKNPSASWIDPTIPPLNARTDAGFKGDGTFADTEKLVNLLNPAYNSGRPIYVPPGIYYMHHPVNLIASTRLFGEGHGTDFHGTEFRPIQAFNVGYNPNGVRACMFQGQIDTDPQTPARWNSYDGLYWHDAKIQSIVIRNSYDGNPAHRVANLSGVGIYSFGENSMLEDVWVEGFDCGFYLTGNRAPFRTHLCSVWNNTDFGYRFEKHPTYGGNYGVSYIDKGSGDGNAPYYFRSTGGDTFEINGLKVEAGITHPTGLALFETAPELIGTGTCYRPSFNLNSCGLTLTTPLIEHPNLIKIQHTGTAAPAEFPNPSINIRGGYFFGITNWVSDDRDGMVMPTSFVGVGDPKTEAMYTRDKYERTTRYIEGAHRFLGAPLVITGKTVAQLNALLPDNFLINAIAVATNGRNLGEGIGAGTGCPALTKDGITWRTFFDNSVLAA